MTNKLKVQEVGEYLWQTVTILKHKKKAGFYKHYVLRLVFFKYLNDTNRIKKFYIPEHINWQNLTSINENIGLKINNILEEIEKNNQRLQGIFTGVDFNDLEVLPDEKLHKVLEHLGHIHLYDDELENPRIIGAIFEYLINKFEQKSNMNYTEYKTPISLVTLMLKLSDINTDMTVYDSSCGTGAMLTGANNLLSSDSKIKLYGQEKNQKIWAICKMNMIMHGLADARIELGDTVLEPKLLTHGKLMKFDRIISNFAITYLRINMEVIKKDTFNRFTKDAYSKATVELALFEHTVASMATNGKMVAIITAYMLEAHSRVCMIRERILKADLVEAVIALPRDLFPYSAISSILILNGCKPLERRNKVIFINARSEFEKGDKRNRISNGSIEKIVNAYNNFCDIEGFCRVVDMFEIEKNLYSLKMDKVIKSSGDY